MSEDLTAEIRKRIAEHREAAEAVVDADAVGVPPQLRERWLKEAAHAEALLELHAPAAAQGALPARCAADGEVCPCQRLLREGENWLSTAMEREALYASNPSWRSDAPPG